MPDVIINFIKEDFMHAITSPTIIITSLIVGWLVYLTMTKLFYYKRDNKDYNRIYSNFVNQLSYAIGRHKGYIFKIDIENRKYTEAGVWERINEVRSARLQLFSICGRNIRNMLIKYGTEWLDDIDSFGKTAPIIMEELSKIE